MLRDAVARGLAEIVGAENVRADVDVPGWPTGLGSWPTGRSEDTAPRPISLRPACELGDTGGSAPGVGLRAGKGYGPTADLPSGVLRGGRADAVVRPRTAEEVRAVVALAGDEGLAVTVRGGGTGLWGGAVPARGGIVVSTEYLAGEPEIHRDDLYVVAGAGTLTGPLRARLADAGLLYPVDPASEAGCTLGGNVGEGACGLRSLKYGTTRNYVLGLELVTAEAKLVTVGARTVKNVAGYDLTRLMVGSEGTLAIATSVVLKVLPLPPDEVVTLYAFPDAMRAAEAAVEINALGFAPVLLEMMDRESLGGLGWAGDDLWKDAGAFLLVGFDGTRSSCEEEASRAKDAIAKASGGAPRAEVRRPECERVLAPRRAALARIMAAWPAAMLENLHVPPASVARLVASLSELARRDGVKLAVWGHIGQGALHAALLPAAAGADDTAVRGTLAGLAGACADLGGAACSVVGVGDRVRGPGVAARGAGLDVLARLKRALDPKDIMNPGKMTYEG